MQTTSWQRAAGMVQNTHEESRAALLVPSHTAGLRRRTAMETGIISGPIHCVWEVDCRRKTRSADFNP